MRPTIFDMLFLMAVLSGGMIGARSGFAWFGYPGGVAGAVFGVTLGFLVGLAFRRLLNLCMERHIRRKSTSALRAELIDDDTPGTYASSLIIAVLLERGEPVQTFRSYILRQLRSEYSTWRKAGLYNLALCYPDLSAKLGSFDPFNPTTEELERLKEIESMPGKD